MSIAENVMKKLGLSNDALNSLYTQCPVGGYRGEEVAAAIAAKFRLTLREPLGQQLYVAGVLSEEEGKWLDDDEGAEG